MIVESKFNKIISLGIFIGVSVGFGLTACSLTHTNILLSAPSKTVAAFLYRAQMAALEKIKLYDMSQTAYLSCVEDEKHFDNPFKQTSHHRCDDLFKAMVGYAHDEQNDKNHDLFKDITVADLNNQQVYQKIQNDFMNEVTENQ